MARHCLFRIRSAFRMGSSNQYSIEDRRIEYQLLWPLNKRRRIYKALQPFHSVQKTHERNLWAIKVAFYSRRIIQRNKPDHNGEILCGYRRPHPGWSLLKHEPVWFVHEGPADNATRVSHHNWRTIDCLEQKPYPLLVPPRFEHCTIQRNNPGRL